MFFLLFFFHAVGLGPLCYSYGPVTSLPGEKITTGMKRQIKEWLESYRPVRQRTVRIETTKDKTGASTRTSPPAASADHGNDNEFEFVRLDM